MIREIVRPDAEQLVINIPREYVHREVEVLVFPVAEGERMSAKGGVSKNLLEFRKIMERARKANIKVPKDVDVDGLIDEMYDGLS